LVVAADRVVAGRFGRRRLARRLLAVAVVLATVPATFFTVRLLAGTWTEPEYAHLRLVRDHVPDMASILGTSGPRETVLTYEDWSSLAWYQTGAWVVAVDPPGYAKLAFDPATFTGHTQAQRREDVARAFNGAPISLVLVADDYGADRILFARRGEAWGTVHQVAATTARDVQASDGSSRIIEGNGWDVVELSPGSRLTFGIAPQAGIVLELRLRGALNGRPVPDRAFRLLAIGPADDARVLGEYLLPATGEEEWQIVSTRVDLRIGERLAIEAIDDMAIQSFLGFVVPSPIPGWRVALETPDAVLLERDP
jgi:hypothetical protein